HHRAYIDDLAAARAHHVWVGGLRAEEGACQVRIHYQTPILRRQELRLLADGRPGVVDKDVETPEPVSGALNSLATGSLVQNIEFSKFGLCAERAKFRQGSLRFGLVAGREHDSSAGRSQSLGHAKTDAAVAAGYECDPLL